MVPFGDSFTNELHNRLQLFRWTGDPGFNQFQLWADEFSEFLHGGLVFGDIADGTTRLWMFTDEIILACDGLEYNGEMSRKASAGREQG